MAAASSPSTSAARISLRVAETLRLRQHLLEGAALVRHLREDEVRGPVHDPDDPAKALAGERLLQRADEGDPAADGGLEVQVETLGVRRVEQLAAARGEQLLVRGDDRLVAIERREHEPAGWLEPSEQLADDVDLGVLDDLHRIGDEPGRIERHAALLPRIPDGHLRDLEQTSGPPGDVVSMLLEQAKDGRAHRAAAEHPDPHGPLAHAPLIPRAERPSVSRPRNRRTSSIAGRDAPPRRNRSADTGRGPRRCSGTRTARPARSRTPGPTRSPRP